jgi:hypothetical protein
MNAKLSNEKPFSKMGANEKIVIKINKKPYINPIREIVFLKDNSFSILFLSIYPMINKKRFKDIQP